MLLGYVRMLCIRVGCYRLPPDGRWTSTLLELLSSRVGVGLLMATLLQIGFTVLFHELATGWIAECNGARMAESLKPLGGNAQCHSYI